MRFYIGLDGHWYLRGVFDVLLWRSPWRKPEGCPALRPGEVVT